VILSKYSFQAGKHAAELAESLKAELVIVNVINQRDVMAVSEAMTKIAAIRDDFYISPEEYAEGIKEGRTAEIKKLIEEAQC